MATSNLDLYRRGQVPLLPQSQGKFLQEELRKLEKQAAGQFDKFQIIEKDVSGALAEITQEKVVRANADGALAGQITTLTATVGSNTAAITAETTARSTADSALSSRIDTLSATVGSNTAAITAETTARANADGALSSQISTLTSTVGSHTTSISNVQSSVNGVLGRVGVTIDNNGYLTGFSLLSDTSNGNPTSVFRIIADRFALRKPGTAEDALYWDSGTNKLVVRGDVQATSVTAGAASSTNPGTKKTGTLTVAQWSISNLGIGANINTESLSCVGGTLTVSGVLLISCAVPDTSYFCDVIVYMTDETGTNYVPANSAFIARVSSGGVGRSLIATLPLFHSRAVGAGTKSYKLTVAIYPFNASGALQAFTGDVYFESHMTLTELRA